MKKQTSSVYVPRWVRTVRKISEFITRPLLPSRIIDEKGNLAKAAQDVAGGNGLLIVFTHFSYRDPMDLVRSVIFTNPVFNSRKGVSPISFHQYNTFVAKFTDFFRVRLFPVVNQDTLLRKGFTHMTRGKGLSIFIDQAANMLGIGGLALVAVNAGRREQLDFADKQRPVGYFVAALQAKGITQYGLLLVSTGMHGAKSYRKQDVGGLNIGKLYTFSVAGYYPLSELLAKPEIAGKAGNIDEFVRKKLAAVAPPEYVPEAYRSN